MSTGAVIARRPCPQRRHMALAVALGVCAALLASNSSAGGSAAEAKPDSARPLTAAQIVDRNVAARGGLAAWRKVQSMVWIGHLESEHAPLPSMGFVLEQQRPNKTRFQLIAVSTRTVRVFDGLHGWKMRPGQDGSPDVQPYSLEELRFAQTAPGIDGPLIDFAAKGYKVSFDGVDVLDGTKAHRLNVWLPSGEHDQVWVDVKNFLDLRYDRPSRGPYGDSRTVSLLYRGYREVEGLRIPALIETVGIPGSTPDRMIVERTVLNPPLDLQTFANPGLPNSRSKTPAGAQASATLASPSTAAPPSAGGATLPPSRSSPP